jgi:hypothetical protein
MINKRTRLRALRALISIILCSFLISPATAQKWKKSKPNTLYARNKSKDLTPILVGIGTKNPSAQLHTTGTVRFEGITNLESADRLLGMDNTGNLFWKNMLRIRDSAWLLTGNAASALHFLGTTNNEDLRIRTNNIQRLTLTKDGLMGIGVTTPSAQLHTAGTVRFQDIINNDQTTRIATLDNDGNLFFRNIGSIQTGNAWILNGNTGTNPSVNFLGTTDNNGVVFKANNIERMKINVGTLRGVDIGTPTINNELRIYGRDSVGFVIPAIITGNISNQTFGTTNGQTLGRLIRLNQVSSTNSTFVNFYDMGIGEDTSFFITNHSVPPVTGNGTIRKKMIVISPQDMVGINLNPGVKPTANLHSVGTVRHEGLPSGTGNPLVIDANGNVFAGTPGNTSNAWSLTGNTGTNPATNFLGTTDNNPVIFKSNNTERLRITETGLIGIGITNPTSKIHIVDPVNAVIQATSANGYGGIVLQGNGPDARSFLSLDNSNSSRRWLISHRSGNSFPGQQDKLFFSVFDGVNWIEKIAFTPGSNNRAFVGFGTVSPTAVLHTVDAIRFENLPSGAGNVLVVDANGNVFKSSAIQSRQSVDDLKKEIDDLKKEIADLKILFTKVKEGNINMGKGSAVLYQNTPNPVNKSTVIKYEIPELAESAGLIITTAEGRTVRSFNLVSNNAQAVNISAGELSAGLYYYSLWVNNKLVDTKSMVITK